MSRRRVLVIGNSHTRALADARSAEPGGAVGEVDIEVFWLQSRKSEDRVVGDLPYEEACERVAGLASADLFVLSIFGAFHNIYGLLRHQQPFWLAPESGAAPEDVPQGSELMPRRVAEAWFRAASLGNRRVDGLLKRCSARRCHLMTPPPKGDNAYIAERTKKYRERVLDDHSISDPVQRLRLWSVERRALAEALRPAGVDLVDPPDAAIDARGFLRREHYGSDATHANAAYGRLVLEQLSTLARGA
ncbi:MAG: hypothetical protein ING89_15320 [Rubrivivax sp.]|nr:hypothetical protein [Rubrivivax sp.]